MKKMTKSAFFILVLSLLSVSIKSYAQTSMSIQLTDGTFRSYNLSATSKVYFLNDNLIFSTANASTAIASIRKITFGAVSGVNNTTENETIMSVSPNPAHDYIVLKNVSDEKGIVKIYSATGAQIISRQINSSTETIDVTSLQKGIYIVRINNQTAKFVKL